MQEHFRKLERMYLNAPVQKIYTGIDIKIEEGRASFTLPVHEKFFHAAGSLHGSVYFRLLDDASYFSVSSFVEDVFLLTSSFQIDFIRPVSKGLLRAEGRAIHCGNKLYLAAADLFDERGKMIATGKGTFMRSEISLKSIEGYEKIK